MLSRGSLRCDPRTRRASEDDGGDPNKQKKAAARDGEDADRDLHDPPHDAIVVGRAQRPLKTADSTRCSSPRHGRLSPTKAPTNRLKRLWSACSVVDRSAMLWPFVALVVCILGFAVVYGSVVQSRLETVRDRVDSARAREG
jgi:hypothetical protein